MKNDAMNTNMKTKRKASGLYETLSILCQSLALAFIVRSLLLQPFSIPSGSMRPTLLKGDYLLVSKWSYGYSRFSFPFSLDIFSGRIWEGKPERGDIVVFRNPKDTSVDFIKRVIGLPGDRIQMKEGRIFINNTPVAREEMKQINNPDITEISHPVDVYRETLPNGVTYETLDIQPSSLADNTPEFHVPPGHYFMIGDNRDNSSDSRFEIGFIPEENLIGKARITFFSVSGDISPFRIWSWLDHVRFSRLLKIIR